MGKTSKLTPTGHLTILKIYKDGTEETVWDEHNVITSGMGVALSHLFSASGASYIQGYQIGEFQVGVSGDVNNYGPEIFALSSALTDADYGDGGAVVTSRSAIENGVLGVAKDFVSIRYSNIHRLSKTAVRFTLVLDDQTANIQDELTEVGLFMNNPQGLVPAAPILVAYRPFAGIKKTDAFSLVFLWTIQF
jgi:hypothetical protein